MPRYSYRCPNGHPFEAYAPVNDQWAASPCCGVGGLRDYRADFLTQSSVCDDQIRKAYLSSSLEVNLAKQERPLDPIAPKDKFEAKHVEAATGRVYVGNNISTMSPKAQKAILNGERKPGQDRPAL